MSESEYESRTIEEMVEDPSSHPELMSDPYISDRVREVRRSLGLEQCDW